MTNVFGFLDKERKNPPYRDVQERIKDYKEVTTTLNKEELTDQAERCMNCGIPFCRITSYNVCYTKLLRSERS